MPFNLISSSVNTEYYEIGKIENSSTEAAAKAIKQI